MEDALVRNSREKEISKSKKSMEEVNSLESKYQKYSSWKACAPPTQTSWKVEIVEFFKNRKINFEP